MRRSTGAPWRSRSRFAPFAAQRDLLMHEPGVKQRAAEVLIAEIGVDMTRVPDPQAPRLLGEASAPGNDQSAGKRRSGKTRKGDKWLRATLAESANAAARTKDSYLAARYQRLRGRRGHSQGDHRRRALDPHRRLAHAHHRRAVPRSRRRLPQPPKPRPAHQTARPPTRSARTPRHARPGRPPTGFATAVYAARCPAVQPAGPRTDARAQTAPGATQPPTASTPPPAPAPTPARSPRPASARRRRISDAVEPRVLGRGLEPDRHLRRPSPRSPARA